MKHKHRVFLNEAVEVLKGRKDGMTTAELVHAVRAHKRAKSNSGHTGRLLSEITVRSACMILKFDPRIMKKGLDRQTNVTQWILVSEWEGL